MTSIVEHIISDIRIDARFPIMFLYLDLVTSYSNCHMKTSTKESSLHLRVSLSCIRSIISVTLTQLFLGCSDSGNSFRPFRRVIYLLDYVVLVYFYYR